MKEFQQVSRRSSGVEHSLGKVGYTLTAPKEIPENSRLFSGLMRLNAPQKGEMGLFVGQYWGSGDGSMRPEIDDTTWLDIGSELSPDGEPVYRGTQAQIDQIVKSTILSCVDQLEESLSEDSGHKVHHWEVDGILRAIDILEMMVEGIEKTGSA